MPVIEKPKYVSSRSVPDNLAKDRRCRNLTGAASFHPRFNGKILQLQTGWITNQDAIPVAVKSESLPNHSRSVGGIAQQSTVVAILFGNPVALATPPAHQSVACWHETLRM